MDLERYYELRTILQQWKKRLADNIRGRIEGSARRLERLQQMYAAEGTDEAFVEWLDRWCRQAAIQFILRLLFLRVLEDRDLLGTTRIRTADGQRMWAQVIRNLGAASYVQWCCRDAAHLLPDLFGPTEYDLVLPDDDLVQRFLDDVWRRPDPNREGWLRFDFRPDPARGDVGFETRFIGDLYQELDAEIRERYALLQTPHFISQFILEHTLLKRFEEKDFREVTLLDPTCGSGHFCVDAFWMFVDRYEGASGKGRDELSAAERTQIARTIIEKHLFGCDINPYATALAHFRLALAACDYAEPTSLRDFRDLHFNLVTIDSLIPYERLLVGHWRADTSLAQAFGQPDAIERALPVLRKRYDVVVGNPPYIQARDAEKRSLYREHYDSAYRKFGLSTPFTERFLHLAVEGGSVGLINSNAFARRQFGKKLIERVLPRYDLETLIDLSGAYIPGHGTPTVILFARNQSPTSRTVLVFSNLRGEESTPTDPAKSKVWTSVLRGFSVGSGYSDEYVDVSARARSLLAEHPWQFGGPKGRLYQRLRENAPSVLDEHSDSIGLDCYTGDDEIYIHEEAVFRRLRIDQAVIKPVVVGENMRDWAVSLGTCIFPYEQEKPLDVGTNPALLHYLRPFYKRLNARIFFGKTHAERALQWSEYSIVNWSKKADPLAIAFVLVSTHNQFLVQDMDRVFQHSSQLIKLRTTGPSSYSVVTALLNSAVVGFCLKQLCYNKGTGNDPVRDRYEHTSTNVGQTPMPLQADKSSPVSDRLLVLADDTSELGGNLARLTMRKLFEKDDEAYHTWMSALDGYVAPHPKLPALFTAARELRAARAKLVALRQEIRGRMIFLQEEMDWLAYEMYGLIKKAPLAEDYLSRTDYEAARLELGQRPFEVAGKGYQGDWPAGYEPSPLPEVLRPLTEARIAMMEANPDIALLEDPLYKRRWVPPDYEQEFREAAEWWLAEKLEWALEQHGRPISLREWARLMGRDERVNATLEVLTGTELFDLEAELLKVIRANAAANRPEHYLKPDGLRKFYAARASDPPGVPEYSSKEFSDNVAWRLRGKLNIPRERFIHYAEFDHTRRGADAPDSGGPWFGWAGWDAGGRADALAFLLDQASRAGWEIRWRQCGLRAALRDLLQELKDLPEAERAEFEAIASACGIRLGTACYCQAYRGGIARSEPGVPGVGAEVLGVKVVAVEGKGSKQGRRKAKTEAEQMTLDL